MPKSAFTDAHRLMVDVLVKARKQSGLTQTELSAKLGKNQSYISNIERLQRRVDVVEFYAIARAMDADPTELFQICTAQFPLRVAI
jgi:transcriptional regulator with XRE-family HTH domain